MINAFNCAATVALWLVSVWRAPGAWRVPSKRPLWAAFTVLAAQMLLSFDSNAVRLDEAIGINSLSALLKHLASVAAAACVVSFLACASASATDKPGPSKKGHQLRAIVPSTAAIAMTVSFALAARPNEALDMFLAFPGDPWVTFYGVSWLTYFGWAMYATTALCLRWSRLPGPRPLKIGLAVVSAGTGIGIFYTLHRAAVLMAGQYGVRLLSPATNHSLNVLLMVVPLLLIAVGSTLPALDKAISAVRTQRDLTALYRLWRDLTDAVPSVRLDPLPSRLADALDLRANRSRLYRRTIEIRDAVMTLSDHASPDLRMRAHEYTSNAGLTGRALGRTSEACWIRAARHARMAGAPATGSAAAPIAGGLDLPSEVRALRGMSAVYFSPLATRFAATTSTALAQEPAA
ncbi:MAB_1171c family putative transporter [Kitasatospora sp. NPDC051914]|uniref:MAB_1171c family putative transporter n=1 Tax=Kitasatospora sp. NPDC051914 TaxID=3154945 RepID=UPI0034397A05